MIVNHPILDLANLLYFPHLQSLIRKLYIFSGVFIEIKLREKENLHISGYLGF